MNRLFRIFLLSAICLAQLSCTVNILENFSQKDSDKAKYIDAKMRMDVHDFDGAVTILLSTSSSFQNERPVKALLASAYAGKGGLIFLSLIESFQNATSGKLFPFMTSGFVGATAQKFGDLQNAEIAINSINADPLLRNEDENILMALVQLAKLGTILNYSVDDDNDGSIDGTFVNACTNANTPGVAIDNDSVGEVGLALLQFLQILPSLSNNFASGVLGSLDDCVADIESIEAAPGVYPLAGVCAITDPADYTATHLAGFRSLIKEDSVIGFGVSCTGDVSACNCPP